MTDLYHLLLPKFHLPSPEVSASHCIILIDIQQQILMLLGHDNSLKQWPVSTAKAGVGNSQGSLQTPLGAHIIADKIGTDETLASIFTGRQASSEVATILNEPVCSATDQITSRILWLKGLEQGINLGGKVDTYERFIYIHGTPEEGLIGTPASHGCIRMRNSDIIDLFDQVTVNTPVYICESQKTLNLV